MDFFISDALAQSGETSGGALQLFFIVGIFVLFFFMFIRPQQKRQKKHKELISSLEVKDEVVTNGGTLGKVTGVDDNFIQLEIAPSVVVQVQRQAIAQLMPEGTYISNLSKKKSKKAQS